MSEKDPIPTFEGDNSTPDAESLAWSFPEVDAGVQPLGGRILVQLRRTKKKVGRIILVDETKESEKWNNMVAKVVAIGPLAYKNRDNMEAWPEGSWIQVGDFIRVPRWGGDRWERPAPDQQEGEDPVLFAVFNDHEVISKVTCNPLSFKAFV